MSAKIVTISNFAVSVDGIAPEKVLQHAVVISDRGTKQPGDVLLTGQLEAQLLTKDYKGDWQEDGFYQNAYIWTQKSTPGMKTHVRVTYAAALRPQPVRYTKTYSRLGEDGLIPFADLNIDDWDDSYYFFDYVLVSGSTWDGPIGRETIEFSADPALGLSVDRIAAYYREPVGFWPKWSSRERRGFSPWLDSESPGYPRWRVSGKPKADYLFSIPASALGKTKAGAKK